jgi:hypothetical protein
MRRAVRVEHLLDRVEIRRIGRQKNRRPGGADQGEIKVVLTMDRAPRTATSVAAMIGPANPGPLVSTRWGRLSATR